MLSGLSTPQDWPRKPASASTPPRTFSYLPYLHWSFISVIFALLCSYLICTSSCLILLLCLAMLLLLNCFFFFFALLVGVLSCRSCACCRIAEKENLKRLKAKCLKHLDSYILVLVTHHHHTSIHEESESAEKSLSDTTMPKKNTALMLVSCSLASARQQKSLLIFHCGECLLLIQIPRAKSRHPPRLIRSLWSFDV